MSDGSMADALAALRGRIGRAALEAGRDPSDVALVAVTKKRSADEVRAAYALGLRDLGENYAQELLVKRSELSDLEGLRWHLIGHLQRNKVKRIAGAVAAVQTVDSPACARDLGFHAAALGRSLDVMVQINVADESQKSGCAPGALDEVLAAIEAQAALRLIGLMTVPPYAADPEASRPWFSTLRSLRETHGGVARLPALSMGMSHDLEVAISCGATVVRVGTALFGERG